MNDSREVRKKSWASVYSTPNFICVQTCSGYRRSGHDPKGAQHLLDPDTIPSLLGNAVADALAQSRFLSPEEVGNFFATESTEQQYAEWVRNLISRYGVKTRRALFKDMKLCQVEHQDEFIVIRPTRHEKLEKWGGAGAAMHMSVPASASDEIVGQAIQTALGRCI